MSSGGKKQVKAFQCAVCGYWSEEALKHCPNCKSSAFVSVTSKLETPARRMAEEIKCPKCGSEMVVRISKKGPNAGRKFYVCSNHPECKGKIAITEQMDTKKPNALKKVVMVVFGGSFGIIYLCFALALSALPIAGIVMLTLYLVDAGPWAPEQCTGELVHYTNSEFGYSIDYPKCWYFEQFKDNEIGIMPKDSEYNQIQIGAFHGEPLIGSMPESWVAATNEASIHLFTEALGCTNLNVDINEPASEKWDWVVAYTFICEDTPLKGEYLITETQSTSYILTVIQVATIDWPEGQDAVNSFKVESNPSP